jgi:hypothetical protein
MQIFHPYASPYKNAKCLDPKRRNKQILELVQLIAVNTNNYAILKQWKIIKPITPGVKNRFQLYKSIKNHPNVKKRKGFEIYLMTYLFFLLKEYLRYNEKDHACTKLYGQVKETLRYRIDQIKNCKPSWFTKESCYEHQSLLISKKPDYYKNIF